jgi:hypothetical protein
MCKTKSGNGKEKIAVFGGRPRTIEKTFIPHLEAAGADVVSYSEFDAVVPIEATAAIVIVTKCSHNLSDKVHDIADARGLKYALVPHQWATAQKHLLKLGIIAKALDAAADEDEDDTDDEEDKGMSNEENTSRLKAVLGDDLAALGRRIDDLSGHQEALATLLAEMTPDSQGEQIKALEARLKALEGDSKRPAEVKAELEKFRAHLKRIEDSTTGYLVKITDRVAAVEKSANQIQDSLARTKKAETSAPQPQDPAVLKELVRAACGTALAELDQRAAGLDALAESLEKRFSQMAPAETATPEEPPIKVNTKAVAERILSDLETKHPHPLTKVDWRLAGQALGLTADNLIDSLTALYGNSGLNETLLRPLAKCGWTLALVNGTTAYPLTGGEPVVLTVPTPKSLDIDEALDRIMQGDLTYEQTPPATAEVKQNEPLTMTQKVVAAVKNAKNPKRVTKAEVMKATGLSGKQVSDHLSHACRQNLVKRIDVGVYAKV